MATTQNLTIRIGADASGAMSVLSAATEQVNQLNAAGNSASRGGMTSLSDGVQNIGRHTATSVQAVASLTGGVQNLGRWSATSTQAMASLTGGVSGLSRSTLDAVNGTNRLNQSLAENTRVASAATGTLNLLKSMLGGLSVAFTAKQILSEISSFETKLLSLKALTMANTEQMKQMETQARQLGATTAFSAQQAAEAQGVLASAGLKVNEILTATPQILQLAAAGSMDLAKAADQATQTMHALGLGVGDLHHIGDVFAKIASDTSTSVELVGESMRTGALSAKGFGVSLEEMAATVGIAANVGIKGAELGNNFKAFLTQLGNDTKENIEVLGRYTVGLDKHKATYKDLSVEALGYTKVIQNLNEMHIGGTDALKLFQSDAMNLGMALANNGKQFVELTEVAKNANGTMQTQSDILNQGLKKSWDALLGVLSEAAIQLGETKTNSDTLAGSLTSLIQTATGVISIYEGMGDQFAKSNKLTEEQYGQLKNVAGQLKVVAGAAEGIGILAGAIWGVNKAAVAFNATLTLIQRHPIMAIAGAGVALYGASQAALSNQMESTDKQIEYYEKRVSKYKDKSVLLRPIDFNLEKENAALSALKQSKTEHEEFLKSQANHSASIKGLVDETEAWFEAANKTTHVIKGHSKSLDADADSAGKSASAHKALTDAQRAAKKEQDEYNRLVEKFKGDDPFEKYTKSMSELYRVQSDLPSETFLLNQQKIAAEFEKSTVDLNAYNNALREQQRLFDSSPRGKFEKGMDELRAQKPYMSEAGYLHEQDKLNVSYLKDTGLDPNAKTQADKVATALEKSKEITKSYENEWEALQKIRREISLNSDAEYEAHIRKQGFSEERIALLKAEHEEIQKLKLLDDIGLSVRGLASSFSSMFSQVLTQGKSFTEALRGMFKGMISKISDGLMNFGMNAMMSGNFLAGGAAMVGSIGVGLLSSLFKDKTIDTRLADSKTEGTVLGGGSSNSIQNVVKTLNDIHAKEYKELQGINDNFALLAKGVDNTVNRAIALHGSFTPSTNGMTSTSKGFTGSDAAGIAGGAIASAAVTGITAGIAAAGAATAAGVGSAASIGVAMGAMAGLAALGPALLVAGAIYGLGKLLGIGKTKYTAIGNGIVTSAIEYTAEGAKEAYTAYDYSTVKAVTKGWFSNKTKIYDVINGIDNEMSVAFGSLFGQLGKTLYDSFSSIGISDLVQKSYVLPALKIDLSKAKTDQEISDAVTKAINTVSDMVATELVGGLFGRFQKMGEGMLQTIGRVAIEMVSVEAGFRKIGVGMNLTGMAGVEFSQSLVSLYESMPNANDGLKNFTASINEFYNTVLTAGQKTAFSLAGWENFAKQFNATYTDSASKQYIAGAPVLNTDPMAVKGSDITAALNITKKLASTASDAFGALSSKAQLVTDATQPFTSTQYSAKDLGNFATWVHTDLKNATWDDVYNGVNSPEMKAATKDLFEKAAQGVAGASFVPIFTDVNRAITANTDKKAVATQALTADFDVGQYQKDLETNSAVLKNIQTANKDIIDSSSIFGGLTAFNEKVSAINEAYLKTGSELETVNRAREREVALLKQIDTTQLEDGSIIPKLRDISNAIDEVTGKPLLSEATKKAFFDWQKVTQGAAADLVITTAEFQQFTWSIEDAAKATKKLADATKYFSDFSTSIRNWVQNLKATQLGTPESQMKAAADNFARQMEIINGGNAYSGEEKRSALSGITGVADSYIQTLKNFYGSTEAGQAEIAKVVEQISGLEKSVDVQSLQLGVLQDIRDGIHKLPEGLTEAQSKWFAELGSQIDAAQKTYIAVPTAQNDLIANALAKEWQIAVSAVSQSSGFLDALIKSFDGANGLIAAVDLVIKNAELDSASKISAVNNVLSNFEKLDFKTATFSGAETAKAAINDAMALLKIEPIYIKAAANDADFGLVIRGGKRKSKSVKWQSIHVIY